MDENTPNPSENDSTNKIEEMKMVDLLPRWQGYWNPELNPALTSWLSPPMETSEELLTKPPSPYLRQFIEEIAQHPVSDAALKQLESERRDSVIYIKSNAWGSTLDETKETNED